MVSSHRKNDRRDGSDIGCLSSCVLSNLTLSVDSIRVSLNALLFERVQHSTSSESRPIADRHAIRKIDRDLYPCDCRSFENRFLLRRSLKR